MPHRSPRSRRYAGRAIVLSVVGRAAFSRDRKRARSADALGAEAGADVQLLEAPQSASEARSTRRRPKRRFATSLAFATLFFAGASLSAGAGDMIAEAIEGTTSSETTTETLEATAAAASEGAVVVEELEAPVEEELPAEEEPSVVDETVDDGAGGEPAEEGPADDDSGEAPSDGGGAGEDPAPAETPGSEPGDDNGSAGNSGSGDGASSDGGSEPEPAGPPLIDVDDTPVSGPTPPDPEVAQAAGGATIWLHRSMPDPTPAARRLTPGFAEKLKRVSAEAKVDWALVLGVLRANGNVGRKPADGRRLGELARTLAKLGAREDEWSAVLALRGRTAFADRAIAAARLHRAVGLRALVIGLEAATKQIQRAVLADARIDVYPGGRADINAGRVDIRVLTTLRYLAEAFGQVTVSSLQSGHRIYSRPGVVSAHVYGLAVDIAALGGVSILGNQAPGSVTEQAVRALLLLPPGLQARQVISLIGMGGASFAMADHHDHIHVGF